MLSTTRETFKDGEVKVLKEFVDSILPLDARQRDAAFLALNKYRFSLGMEPRTKDSVVCKLLRMRKGHQGSQVLAPFDCDEAIDAAEKSSALIESEMQSLTRKRRFTEAQDRIRTRKSQLAEDRVATLKRRKQEDAYHLDQLKEVEDDEAQLCRDFADYIDEGRVTSC
jgi:hypothetical protein